MIFAAVIEYSQDKEKIAEQRPAHRAYLTSLLQNDQLVASGPITDDSGALIIYEAASADEAEKLLRADPFHAAGIFLSWKIRPWKPVMANAKLLPQ